MRRLINSTYITLDGVIEGPHLWPSVGPPDERWEQLQADLLLSCDALLMGRRTYEGFAPVWPIRSGDPVSDHINSMPKYVVSSTLNDPEWHNTQVLDGDVVAAITRLKESPVRTSCSTASAPSRVCCSSTACWTNCGSACIR